MTVYDTPEFTYRYKGKYYGKYRGYVVDNKDPDKLGRLKLIVPEVSGVDFITDWAYPCLPYGGNEQIGLFMIPPIGQEGALNNRTLVWVEFEGGDIEKPIWSGVCWEKPNEANEVPTEAQQDDPTKLVLKTVSGHLIEIEDKSGSEEIKITHKNGAYVRLTSNKVIIDEGTIELGSGATEALVKGTSFQTWFNGTFETWCSTHIHPTGVGPSGAPTTAPAAMSALSGVSFTK